LVDLPLTPYPYQQRDIDNLVSHDGTGIIATQVGGGKTLVAIEVAMALKTQTNFVIAPKGTHKRAWEKTIKRQIPNAEVKYINSTKKGHAVFDELQQMIPGWYLVSPEFFRSIHWAHIEPDLAIFDEIHRASNRKSKTAKMLHTLKAQRRIGMSGTIAGNSVEGFWSVIRWIYPDKAGRSFWAWANTFCAVREDYWAGKVVDGEKNPGAITSGLPCYIRHLKREECCEFHPNGMDADLPRVVVEERSVELSSQQRKIYDKMEKDLFVWLDENPLVAEVPVATRARLRQITLGTPSISETGDVFFDDDCKSSKIDELFAIIADHTQGEPMLILTHSQKFASVVTKRIQRAGHTAFEWSGKANQKARDIALEEFIAGKIQFIVAVIAAIGEGTDGLQERCSVMVWLSKDDNGILNEQAMGRLDRQGQKRAVISYEIIAENTYDSGQLSHLITKQIAMNASLKVTDKLHDEVVAEARDTQSRLTGVFGYKYLYSSNSDYLEEEDD
jgi:SNF2 family DNA or RNA helicase